MDRKSFESVSWEESFYCRAFRLVAEDHRRPDRPDPAAGDPAAAPINILLSKSAELLKRHKI